MRYLIHREVLMKSWNFYCMVSALVFTLVCLAHLLRNLSGWRFVFGPFSVPTGFSWMAFLVAGGLAIWGWTQAHRE